MFTITPYFNIYTISILFSLVFIMIVLKLVKKKALQERYSLIWIITSAALIILSSTPKIINALSMVLGIKNPPSFLFLFGLIFLIIYNLYITVIVSNQAEKITRLTQEIVLVKQKTGLF